MGKGWGEGDDGYPLAARMEAGAPSSGADLAVMDLLQWVEVVGHCDRPVFAPRITVQMRDGTRCQGEFLGIRIRWKISRDSINWPTLARLINGPLFDTTLTRWAPAP
jgi:hypothetical protein